MTKIMIKECVINILRFLLTWFLLIKSLEGVGSLDFITNLTIYTPTR